MLSQYKKILVILFTSMILALTNSCGNNSSSNIEIPGIQGPQVALLQDTLVISMVFENMQIESGLRYNIPKYKYSYLEISPDFKSPGTLLSFSISLKDIQKGGLDMLDPQKLPGGRSIPGVANGSLPGVIFSLEKFHNMAIYLNDNAFGIFIPFNIGLDGEIASFRYFLNSKSAGTYSIVGKDEKGENSGLLLMINLTEAAKYR